ncbi:hypothetical protein LCGC14_1892650 [marine sediment metagenome]|uniref:Uncharacterized protein n=1 Tax=marine sediment metagenome TaxID=412755 RepID=A0A0F9IX16_9ZZZZ
MVTSFRDTFITFALIGIFIFASISFIVTTQKDNNVDETILENDVINRTYINLEANLSSFRGGAQEQKESFELDVPEPGFGSLIIFAIVGVGQIFSGMILGIYNVFIVLPASILGISPVVIQVLTTIIIISLILLIWRVYRVGA